MILILLKRAMFVAILLIMSSTELLPVMPVELSLGDRF